MPNIPITIDPTHTATGVSGKHHFDKTNFNEPWELLNDRPESVSRINIRTHLIVSHTIDGPPIISQQLFHFYISKNVNFISPKTKRNGKS